MANKNNIFTAIGALALGALIYKVGEIKGSVTTGVKFAKDPKRGEEVKDLIDKFDKAKDGIKNDKNVDIRITKDNIEVDVKETAEEAEETAEEAEEPDEE